MFSASREGGPEQCVEISSPGGQAGMVSARVSSVEYPGPGWARPLRWPATCDLPSPSASASASASALRTASTRPCAMYPLSSWSVCNAFAVRCAGMSRCSVGPLYAVHSGRCDSLRGPRLKQPGPGGDGRPSRPSSVVVALDACACRTSHPAASPDPCKLQCTQPTTVLARLPPIHTPLHHCTTAPLATLTQPARSASVTVTSNHPAILCPVSRSPIH